MSVPVFDEKELEIKSSFLDLFGFPINTYSYPVAMNEAVKALLNGKPYWMMNGMLSELFAPIVNPDNVARGLVFEAQQVDMKDFGGKDMFGVEWEFIEQVGGSMVRPGQPMFTDANDIMEGLVWPDIDSWDWEGSAERNKNYLDLTKCNELWIMNGWFERLVSFMDFENAIMAIFDEDQQDSVHAFFDKLSDMYIRILDKFFTYFPGVDGVCIHDDWGSQKETFFSPALAEKMIVPYMKRVTDFIHTRGKFCELHSCGHNVKQVENYIKAGWDIWQGQPMNDIKPVFEKYGDQIILGAFPEPFDVNDDEAARTAARIFVDTYMLPGKNAILNFNAREHWTPAFMEEIYSYSRKKACGLV